MSTVQEIEQAIEQLPTNEFWELSEWVVQRREDDWDRQIQADAAAGRLDFLFEEAEAEGNAGQLRNWPPPRAMNSRATSRFWNLYWQLPDEVQRLARNEFIRPLRVNKLRSLAGKNWG